MTKHLLILAGLALLLTSCAAPQNAPVTEVNPSWIMQTEQDAIADGVTAQTAHAALDGFVPNAKVVELDKKQPEGTITFAAYERNIISQARIKRGAELMQRYRGDLSAAEQRTGVPAEIIVALWGVESSFGDNMGNFETVNSLATLAYEGRRAAFFRAELFAALHIVDQEQKNIHQLRGSWAGAMGQCQFMPSTYLKFAVDGDGDGKRDIWTDPSDVIASIANYLASEAWQRGYSWGREVQISNPIDSSLIGLAQAQSVSQWQALGITELNGSPLMDTGATYSLIEPDGPGTKAFLVADNLRALMRWNHSTYFAVSVGILSDNIRQY